ncbi:hypothetical protein N0V82_002620 [Gnomoniopsis sp. IMI 355080]|nr:hypothetical protein N0V82_002620 [Gnomoniopsis sp. IMI 355080]
MSSQQDTDIPALLSELNRLANGTTDRLTAAVADADNIINILQKARDQIAEASSSHTASLTLTRLQNPVRQGFEAINDDLKKSDRVRKDVGKALTKRFPARALPTEHDAMAKHPELINRAITWHLLREGQFNVASTFIHEAEQAGQLQEKAPVPEKRLPIDDTDMDAEQDDEADDDNRTIPNGDMSRNQTETTFLGGGDDEPMAEVRSLESHQLQEKFSTMYSILSELKQHNLIPAIQWAHQNTAELESRGSDLEFELCKRQYVYLVQQQQQRGSSGRSRRDDHSGGDLSAAMAYARSNFPPFADRHAKEIAQLASALVFQSNLPDSPYAALFSPPDSSFDDIAASFTREFCSLLGLSAESPLYVAATAGAISLPKLMKYVEQITAARASWTTAQELAFETPLPNNMIYHSIFVCPVSKEQTTDENPPMMLPCGHVLAKESLRNLVRSHSRYKCPYCPVEGQLREARQIIL